TQVIFFDELSSSRNLRPNLTRDNEMLNSLMPNSRSKRTSLLGRLTSRMDRALSRNGSKSFFSIGQCASSKPGFFLNDNSVCGIVHPPQWPLVPPRYRRR